MEISRNRKKKWIRGHFLTLNYPEEFVDSSLNDSAMNISSVVLLMQNPKLERAKKILIYDAIRAASSDHMKESELNMIAKLAYLMGKSLYVFMFASIKLICYAVNESLRFRHHQGRL